MNTRAKQNEYSMNIYDYIIDEKQIVGIGPLMQRSVSDNHSFFIQYEFELILSNVVVVVKSPGIDWDDLKRGEKKTVDLSNACRIQYHELKDKIAKKFKTKVA